MYNINDFYNEYKYIELKDTIKNDFIASILLGIDNKYFRKNINDFKDIIEYYKTKLNKFVNEKYNKNFSKNNKDHLNILEKLIKYNLVVYNVNKNKISYENDNKNFNKYIILLNKDNKTHLLFKYKDQKKITKLSKNDLINTDIMNGGKTPQSQPAATENSVYHDATDEQSKNIDINGSKDLLKKNINRNLKLIDILNKGDLNDKIKIILTNLSNIIKELINKNEIIYNPLKKEKKNYDKSILDYKDIIELYILNGHDAKKDFENKSGVFQKKEGKKHYNYFENYKFLELYIIFYNLTKNNDSFNINLVTCRLAYYISIKNYFDDLKKYIPHIIDNLSENNEETIVEYINLDDIKSPKFEMKTDDGGNISFFIVIALNDFEFNEYSSFNVLNNLHSNLLIENKKSRENKESRKSKENKITPSIADTKEPITIFKLYDAQNNAKTQLNILEDIPFIKKHNIKQLVLLSNFIDSGNIGADALDRLQDYKKYISGYKIDQYKGQVHDQFMNLCNIFTFNNQNKVNIEITQKDNVTEINLNEENILNILDPIKILQKNKDIINNKSFKTGEYKISVNIDSLKIFEIIIYYEDIRKYFYNDLQYLKFSKVNYNTINNISNLIKSKNISKNSDKIKKLLNLKALGDFSHCIFLDIFKSQYELDKQNMSNNQTGGSVSVSNIINKITDKEKEILHKMNNLFYFAEEGKGSNRKFRFNIEDKKLYEKYNKLFFPIKFILPGSKQKIIFLNINGTNIGNNLKVNIGKNYYFRIHRTDKETINKYFKIINQKKRRRRRQSGGENNIDYEVEKILDHKSNNDNDIDIVSKNLDNHEFLVNWKGYIDPVDDTWEEYINLQDARGSIKDYINKIRDEELFIHVSENSTLNPFEDNTNEDDVKSVDVINLIYNFFYILCDNLENIKDNLNNNEMKKKIEEYITLLNDNINKINFNEIFITDLNSNYIGKYININDLNILKQDQLEILKQYDNRYFNYILNILFKIYLYDELLFMIIARKFESKINNRMNTSSNSNNQEDPLIQKLIEVYNELNNENNYLKKIEAYFSIPGLIEKKLNKMKTNDEFEEEYNSRIDKLEKRFKDPSKDDDKKNRNIENKMFMISTIDNLLKTYCLANYLSFSVDGGIITYNQSD